MPGWPGSKVTYTHCRHDSKHTTCKFRCLQLNDSESVRRAAAELWVRGVGCHKPHGCQEEQSSLVRAQTCCSEMPLSVLLKSVVLNVKPTCLLQMSLQ